MRTHRIAITPIDIGAYRSAPRTIPGLLIRATSLANLICTKYNLGTQCRTDVANLITQYGFKCDAIEAFIPQMKIVKCD